MAIEKLKPDSQREKFSRRHLHLGFLEELRIAAGELLTQPRYLLVLRLTTLLLLLYGSSSITLDVPLRIVCGLMLLSPALLTNQLVWLFICGIVWWVNGFDWLWIDNHKILMSYWCLVCALGISAKDPNNVLSWNGRLLIGLTFLFATGWKILAGEYWNGAFLHYTFLTDPRLEAIAIWVGRLNPDVLPQNRWLELTLKLIPQASASVTLMSSSLLQLFAWVSSYWTLLIEASVAVAFLVPGVRWLARWRDLLLLLFIATTYFILPVLGFAYILIIMGLAQCPTRQVKIRSAYLSLFALLQFSRLFY
jgi:hypothetical protein